MAWPTLPFSDRVGLVFSCFGLAVMLSLPQPRRTTTLKVDIEQIDHATSSGFNLAALAVIAILLVVYAVW